MKARYVRPALLLAILPVLAAATLARAAGYPEHYITLVVPLAAGSGTDAVARLVAAGMADALGVKIVIENKVGASGTIGSAAVARAAPDGYTLLVGGTTTHAADPSLMKNVPYDPVKDFAPVGQLGVYPYALLVSARSPYHSVGDLVAGAKTKTGTMSFAYANALGQLSGELLKRRAGLDLAAVAYRGSPQAITDIVGGRVTMVFVDVPPAVAQIEAGTLRPLAVTTETRTAILPAVPTMDEAGFGGPRVEAWNGIFAPAHTPKPVIEKLAAVLRATLDNPALKARLAAIGFDAQPATSGDFGKRVAAEVAQWAKLTKEAGLEPQ